MKLTSKTVEAALPKDREHVLWDHDLSCLGARVRPGGAKTFIVRTRVGRGRMARKITLTLGKPGLLTVEEARRRARTALADASLGKEPERPHRKVASNVSELCALWVEKASGRSRQRGRLSGQVRNPRNIAIDVGRIDAHIILLLGKAKLSVLNAKAIEAFRDAVARGDTRVQMRTRPRGVRRVRGGEGTATRTLRLLSSILTFAVREGLMDANPAVGVEKTPDRNLERFLSAEEMRRVGETLAAFEAKGAHHAGIVIVRMLALSGARKGEVERLQWSEVDLRTGFLRLARSKTGAKLIPVTGPMRAILDDRAAFGTSGYVFAGESRDVHFQGTPKLLSRVRKSACLDDVRLHDLRHSAASFGLAGGLGLEVIGKLLGHNGHQDDVPICASLNISSGPVRVQVGGCVTQTRQWMWQ